MRLLTHHMLLVCLSDRSALDSVIVSAIQDGTVNIVHVTPAAFELLASQVDETFICRRRSCSEPPHLFWPADGIWIDVRMETGWNVSDTDHFSADRIKKFIAIDHTPPPPHR